MGLFLAIWYYIFGYAVVRVTGFGTERLLNILAYKEVYVFDVSWQGAGVSLKLPQREYAVLEGAVARVGCTIESVSYGGLPHILKRLRGREVLGFGCLFFAAALYFLSSFVWVVSVEGNARVSTEEILGHCAEIGLSPASWKDDISTAEVTKSILIAFPDISWVSVGIRGTTATIKVAESIEQVELVDKETPMDFVATKDGVIVQVTAERGTPLVQEGDVVQAGDVLISARMQLGLEGEEQWAEFVHAEGSVMARTWYTLTEEMAYTDTKKIETGVVENNFALYFGDQVLDAIQPHMEGTYDIRPVYTKYLTLGDFAFPVGIGKETYVSYELEEYTWQKEAVMEKIDEKITKKAENILESRGTIEKMEISYTEIEDVVKGVATVVAIEEIGEAALGEKGWDENTDGTIGEGIANGE